MVEKIDRRTLLGGLGAAAAFSLLPGHAMAQSASIDIGTMGVGSTWYQYGVLLSQYMKRALPEGSVVNVRPYAAADGNLRLIQSNDRIQVGMTFSTNIAWAKKGMTEISDATADDVRLIAGRLDQYYIGMAASADFKGSTISEAISEKRPLRISTLAPGSLGEIGTLLILKAHGIDEETLNSWGGNINRVGIDAASEGLVTGRADIWINPISIGHPKMTELAFSHDIKLLGLSEDAITKMEDFGFSKAELPAGSFRGQDDSLVLPGTSTTIIVNKSMDDKAAYTITKSIIDNVDAIKAENAALSRMDTSKAPDPAYAGGLALHPGAEKAYKEAGLL